MVFKIPVSVLVVIHSADLQVLLLERADRPGFWQSVTGSSNQPDEPLISTAQREVFEETGIQIASGAFIDWQKQNKFEIYPIWRARYAPGVTHNTEHVFSLEIPTDTPITLCEREHLQYSWLPWAQAAQKCFSWSNAAAIRELPARVRDPS